MEPVSSSIALAVNASDERSHTACRLITSSGSRRSWRGRWGTCAELYGGHGSSGRGSTYWR